MDFKFTIAVAADGALGSVARYLVGVGGKAVRIGIYVGHADNQRDRFHF
jgi:hypothetical protein